MAKKKRKQITVTTPGWQPDWQSLIQTDPTYAQFHAGQVAQSGVDRAGRNTGIFQALTQFGGVPEGVDLGDFSLSPEQLQAIQANTAAGTSETAQLQRGHEKSVQDLQDMLAARGILRSGGLGVGLGLEQQDYAAKQANARQALLNALAGLQKAFSDAESGRVTDNDAAAQAAVGRLEDSGLYKPKLSTQTKAHRVGPNLYQDTDGNYYDRQGNHVESPGGQAIRNTIHPRVRRARYQTGYRP